MMRRLNEYVASRPKRAVQIILTLTAALMITVAGMFLVLSETGPTADSPDEPPYPSMATPLSLVEGGIMWKRDHNTTVAGHGMNYSEFKCCWGYSTSNGSSFHAGDLVNDDDQIELSKGINVTVETWLGVEWPWYDRPELNVSFSIHDVSGDGIFGTGDFIVMIDAPRNEGIVYTWALVYVYAAVVHMELSYAFQDGVFYSWSSSELPTQDPWWEPLLAD